MTAFFYVCQPFRLPAAICFSCYLQKRQPMAAIPPTGGQVFFNLQCFQRKWKGNKKNKLSSFIYQHF